MAQQNMQLFINTYHLKLLSSSVAHPARLNIEISGSCNLNCIMCRGGRDFQETSIPGSFMSAKGFAALLENLDLHRLKTITLAGNTEPLLNPEAARIIDICKYNNLNINIITNGMLLTPEISNRLAGWPGEIHISWGGGSKETFESIRKGAHFETILDNVRYITELKKRSGVSLPYVWLNPIIMQRNAVQLPQVVQQAHELGCQGVAASHLIVTSAELVEESLFFNKKHSNDCLQQTFDTAKQLGVQIILPKPFSLDKQPDSVPAWKTCCLPWDHAILGLKNIMPCNTIQKIEGDEGYHQRPFINTWNNKWYADTRFGILSGKPREECLECKNPGYNVDLASSYFSADILKKIDL